MTQRTARITWLTAEQGGRGVPPSGPRYVAPVRFDGGVDASECGNWSLVVELVTHPAPSADWIADVRFLADEAPQTWLTDGASFALYEGKKRVAVGTIVAETHRANEGAGVALPTHDTHLTK